MRFGLVAVVLLMQAAAATGQGAPLDGAKWLAGCWELRAPGRVTLEMWMPAAGDLMLGASRTMVGNTVREYEQLRLRAEGGKLLYIAAPSGQRETTFTSTVVSDTVIVFENPQHDFPQRIIYRRRGADSIVARVEGPIQGAPVRGSNFPYARASCLTAAPPPPAPPPDTLMFDARTSPNGRELLLVFGTPQNLDLYIATPAGAITRRITDHAAIDYKAAWSPDGRRIAFTSTRDRHQEIYLVNADGTGLTQLTTGTVENSDPSWTPDGRQIVFRSERDRNANIYIMNADGSNARALTSDTTAENSPAVSPDGRRIAFAAPRAGHSEVFVMNLDGTGSRQLTTTATGHSGIPIWSPDGRRIAFWSTRDGNDEVYIMNADGSGVTNLTQNPARDNAVSWTPDGRYILFRSTRDRRSSDIYRMRPDGSEVTRVTTTR